MFTHERFHSQLVQFPLHDLDELDRIRAELNAAGLKADDSVVGSLN